MDGMVSNLEIISPSGSLEFSVLVNELSKLNQFCSTRPRLIGDWLG